MKAHTYCDGMKRRDFLRVGALAGTGLTLANFLRMTHAGQVASGPAKAAIFVNLGGGPSHMDTFDLKPDAPSEYRGEFNPIPTSVAGIQISEHLPKLAQCMQYFTILRGVSHTLAAHELGTKYMNTGNRPLPSLEFPGYGAVVSKERPQSASLPSWVAVPNTASSAGYLGLQYSALSTGATPRAGQPFTVRGLALDRGLTLQAVDRRQKLLDSLDNAFASYEKESELLRGMDNFSQQAYAMVSSAEARQAFDTSLESASITKLYGESELGMSCLLATRLVEAGVKFVTVSFGGWDTHNDNFNRLKTNQLPKLDEGLAGLFQGLHAKGLLESTAVFVTGEFGRTPKINTKTGRDHWPRAMFSLLGGGGIRGGQVLGQSDDKAMGPAGEPITPDQIAASFYKALGIDSHKEYHTNTGRPVMIVREGEPLSGLFG